MNKQLGYLLSALIFSSCLLPSPGPEIEARVLSRTILITARDESRVGLANATVKVRNAQGKELLFGKTDKNGHFLFGPSKIEELFVAVYQEDKLLAEVRISKSQLEKALPQPPDTNLAP